MVFFNRFKNYNITILEKEGDSQDKETTLKLCAPLSVLEVCPQSHSFDVIAFGILIVLNYYMFNEGQILLLIIIYCIMCLSNKGIQGMYLV